MIGVGFEHMRVRGQLENAMAHPSVDLVGVYYEPGTETECRSILDGLGIQVPEYCSMSQLIDGQQPDVAFVCSGTDRHPELVEILAHAGVHTIVEKPMATTVDAAYRMKRAAEASNTVLVVNWPLTWYPVHRTAQRLISEGLIGAVQQLHYYDGNRGPLLLPTDTRATAPGQEHKNGSWWYSRPRAWRRKPSRLPRIRGYLGDLVS